MHCYNVTVSCIALLQWHNVLHSSVTMQCSVLQWSGLQFSLGSSRLWQCVCISTTLKSNSNQNCTISIIIIISTISIGITISNMFIVQLLPFSAWHYVAPRLRISGNTKSYCREIPVFTKAQVLLAAHWWATLWYQWITDIMLAVGFGASAAGWLCWVAWPCTRISGN